MTARSIRAVGWLAIFAAVCLTVAVSDRVLGFYLSRVHGGPQTIRSRPSRAIRLAEMQPGLVQHIALSKHDLEGTDALTRTDYVVRVDEDGFIMPSRLHVTPDWTLVFLGGSTTECLFMDEVKRFPYVVGRLLEAQTGKKVNSFNGGRSGNHSLNSIVTLIGKVLPLKPDVAIMMENVNDLTVLLLEGSYWNDNPTRSLLISLPPPENRLWLYYIVRGFRDLLIKNSYAEALRIIGAMQRPPDEFAAVRRRIQIDERTIVETSNAVRKNLELFVYICRLHNIVPVLMTQESRLAGPPDPFTRQRLARVGIEYAEYKILFDRVNEVVRAIGRNSRVVVIDLASEIPPSREYLYDMVHFTETGSMAAASTIARELKRSVLGK